MNSTRIGDWIETYTGKQFYPLDPYPEDIDVRDIAHALSNLCRFTGHCRAFYSVAEHSIYVSTHVPKTMALQALFHDAPEAYIADISGPLSACILLRKLNRLSAVSWNVSGAPLASEPTTAIYSRRSRLQTRGCLRPKPSGSCRHAVQHGATCAVRSRFIQPANSCRQDVRKERF